MFVDQTDWLQLLARVAMAMAGGGVIGWNRQRGGKPAGLRTHVLVAVGACLFTLVPQAAATGASAEVVSRVIQGVAVGIGFLGAGEIFRRSTEQPEGHTRIKGLTSAAAMWVTAAFGVVAGCGLWRLLVVSGGVVILVLTVMKRLERIFFSAESRDSDEAP
jgi:putative Mg2+ transporter-C (MgtC) family protein